MRFAARLLVLVALSVPAATAAARPQTGTRARFPSSEPLRAALPPLRVVAVGDYGTTEPESFEVAALVRALAPRFLITLGDNNYPSGEADTIDENIGQHYHDFIKPYTGNYGPGAVTNRFFPCLGNHDWSAPDAQPYLDYFELPGNERYYDFRRGPLHFFALDSDGEEPDGVRADSVQAAWLEAELARSDAPFKIVYLHHAPYSSSDNHGSQGDLQWPFKEWGASLVLAGHDHLYERSSVSGLTYVVNGLGGRNVYPFADPHGGSELRFNAQHGALLVEADAEFAHLSFVTSLDTVQDDFVLPRGGVDPGTDELIGLDAEWSYLDTGVDPGPSWARPNFDDSGWLRGRGEFGYGEGDETTVLDFGGDTAHRHITSWFRYEFSLASPEEFETLQLRLLYDDGVVAYLNGVEVARARMPAGVITPSTLASSAASTNQERTFDPFTFGADGLVHLHPRQLATGRNVLALELHQASASSSDLSLSAELVGLRRGVTLLPRGSLWRYLDTGVAPTPGWNASAFDDSGWALGPAQLGYGEDDEATVVASGPTTTWFRTTFDVTDVAAIRWLSCRFLRDDGAIVYLNGEEALRLNLPRTGVTPSTFAAFNVGQEDEGQYSGTSLDPRLLHDGPNTIAVQLHQASAVSTDLSFDLELVAH